MPDCIFSSGRKQLFKADETVAAAISWTCARMEQEKEEERLPSNEKKVQLLHLERKHMAANIVSPRHLFAIKAASWRAMKELGRESARHGFYRSVAAAHTSENCGLIFSSCCCCEPSTFLKSHVRRRRRRRRPASGLETEGWSALPQL